MTQRVAEKYQGKPCIFGHSGLRYKCNSTCVKCSEEQQLIRRPLKGRKETEKQIHLRRKLSGCTFISSVPCVHGHVGERYIRGSQCKTCAINKSTLARQNQTLDKKLRDNKARELWRIKNKQNPLFLAKRTASQMKRQVAKLNATPSWTDIKAIQDHYIFAKYLEELSGTKFHVDHIVPLKGKNVCGLHVEYNLQVLPAKENISKSNKLIEAA